MLHVTIHLKRYRSGLWAFWVEWPIGFFVPGYVNESMCKQGARRAAEALGRIPTFIVEA